MPSVDQRVVQMRFDNAQFERGVSTTLSSLDKLKNGLNLNGASKGLNDLSHSAKNFKLDGVGNAIDAVNNKFSTMGTIADQVLRNITNSAMSMATNFVKSFTIAPIKQGFGTYETKIGAIQQTMAATNLSEKEVTTYLDDLQGYADKTIYHLSDMTRSLGKFTAAGVDIDTATKAIKGLGNAAALSGSDTAEFSRAIYNVSQALGAGKMLARDWMSIENASMATKEFKETLIDAAIAAGTLEKAGDHIGKNAAGQIVTFKNVRDTLASGWLTADVLVKGLNAYNDTTTELGKKGISAAQDVKTFTQMLDVLGESVASAWSSVYTNVIGNLEQAKAFWTPVNNILSNIFVEPVNRIAELAKAWADLNGRVEVMNTLKNVFFGLAQIIMPIKEGIQDIFPPMTATRLESITKSIEQFTRNLNITNEAAQGIRNVVAVLLAPLRILLAVGEKLFADVIIPAAGMLGKLINNIFELASGLKQVADPWREVNKLSQSRSLQYLTTIVEKASLQLKGFKNNFKSAIDTVKQSDSFKRITADIQLLKAQFQKTLAVIGGNLADVLQDIAYKFKLPLPTIDTLTSALQKIVDVIADVLDFAVKGSGTFNDILRNFKMGTSNASGASKILGTLKAQLEGIFSIFTKKRNADPSKSFSFIDKIKNYLNTYRTLGGTIIGISKNMMATFTGLGQVVSGPMVAISNWFSNFSKSTGLENLLSVARTSFGGVLVFAVTKMVNQITRLLKEPEKVGVSLRNSLKGITTSITKTLKGVENILVAYQNNIKADIIKKIAVAVAILAGSILVLSTIPTDNLIKAGIAIGALMGSLVAITAILNKITEIKSVSREGAIGGILGKLFGEGNNIAMVTAQACAINQMGSALVKIAASVAIMSVALKMLGSLSLPQIGTGLLGIVGILGSIAAFCAVMKIVDPSGIGKSAGKMIVFGITINIMAKALSRLSTIPLDQMESGLRGFGRMLGDVAVFAAVLSATRFGMKQAIAVDLLVMGILGITDPILKMAKLNTNELHNGLYGLGVGIAELAAFTAVLSFLDPGKLMTTSNAVGVLAGALIFIGFAVKIIAKLEPDQLRTGLAGLTVILLEVGATIAALNYIGGGKALAGAGAILVLAGALALLAPVIVLLGTVPFHTVAQGLLVIGVALGALLAGAAIASLAPVAAGLVTLSVSLLALGAATLGIGAGLALAAAGLVGLQTAITVFSATSPLAIAGAIANIELVLQGILGFIPSLLTGLIAGFTTIISAICGSIVATIPKIITTIGTVLGAVLELIIKYVPKIVQTIGVVLDGVIQLIGTYVPKLVEMAVSVVTQVVQSLAAHVQDFVTAALNFIQGFIQGLTAGLPGVLQAAAEFVITLINSVADTLRNNTDALIAACDNLVSALIESFGKWMGHFIEKGLELLTGMGEGIVKGGPKVVAEGGKILGNLIKKLGSGVGDAIEAGKNVIAGFVKGIGSKIKDVGTAAAKIPGKVTGTIRKGLDIHSPSGETEKLGENTGEGYRIGLDKSSSGISNVVGKIVGVIKNGFGSTANDAKGIGETVGGLGGKVKELSSSLDPASMFAKRYGTDIEDLGIKTKDTADATKEATKETEKSTDALNDSTEATEKAAKSSAKNAEANDKEAKSFKSKTEAYEAAMNAYEYASDVASGAVSEFYRNNQQFMSGLSDSDKWEVSKAAIWDYGRILAMQSGEFDESSSALDKLGQSTKETSDYTKDYEERVKSIAKALEDYRKKIKDTISGQIDIFEEWKDEDDEENPMTKDKLLSNMQSQVSAMTKWFSDINELSMKGIDDSLLNHLRELGPKGEKYVKAFLQMSADELNTAASYFKTSQDFPGKIADSFIATSAQMIAQESDSTAAFEAQSRLIGNNVTAGLVNGIKERTDDARAAGEENGQAVVDGTAKGAGTASPSYKTHAIGNYIVEGLVNGIRQTAGTARIAATTMANEVISAIRGRISKANFNDVGKNIAIGLANGIRNNISIATRAAGNLSGSVLTTSKNVLRSHSPSKAFYDLGYYVDQGFANGIAENQSGAIASVQSMSEQVLSAITNPLAQVAALVNNGISDDLTITPVLDTSNVENGIDSINSMFNSQRFMVSGISSGFNGYNYPGSPNGKTINTTYGNMTVNIYGAPGQDVNELARLVENRITTNIRRQREVYNNG